MPGLFGVRDASLWASRCAGQRAKPSGREHDEDIAIVREGRVLDTTFPTNEGRRKL